MRPPERRRTLPCRRRPTPMPDLSMVGFVTTPISGPITLGQQLYTTREGLGLTVEACARQTGIGAHYLQALESGAFEQLPGDVYTKCFLRTYATTLQLPVAVVMTAYRREVKLSRRRVLAADQRLPLRVASRWHFVVAPKLLRLGVGLAVVGLFLGYLGVKVEAIVRPPELTVDGPASVLLTDGRLYELAGRTEPGTLLSVNGASVPVDPLGAFRQSLTLPEGVTTIRVVARKNHSREQVVERHVIVRTALQ